MNFKGAFIFKKKKHKNHALIIIQKSKPLVTVIPLFLKQLQGLFNFNLFCTIITFVFKFLGIDGRHVSTKLFPHARNFRIKN